MLVLIFGDPDFGHIKAFLVSVIGSVGICFLNISYGFLDSFLGYETSYIVEIVDKNPSYAPKKLTLTTNALPAVDITLIPESKTPAVALRFDNGETEIHMVNFNYYYCISKDDFVELKRTIGRFSKKPIQKKDSLKCPKTYTPSPDVIEGTELEASDELEGTELEASDEIEDAENAEIQTPELEATEETDANEQSSIDGALKTGEESLDNIVPELEPAQ